MPTHTLTYSHTLILTHSHTLSPTSVVRHLRGRGFEVEDKGTDKYYEVAADVAKVVREAGEAGNKRGMLFCGTGMGVGIIAIIW